MRIVNTVELKNKTNQLLHEVIKGQPIIVTYRGKPSASIMPLTEDEIEDFIIENSPSIRKKIRKAEKDIKANKVISLDEYLLGNKS
jgi:prevent-host-death family protein